MGQRRYEDTSLQPLQTRKPRMKRGFRLMVRLLEVDRDRVLVRITVHAVDQLIRTGSEALGVEIEDIEARLVTEDVARIGVAGRSRRIGSTVLQTQRRHRQAVRIY